MRLYIKNLKMADSDDETDNRNEKLELINGLKSVVERLMSAHTLNPWNTYGGLERVCQQVNKILNHGLRSTQGEFGSQQDVWPFVQCLKQLNPMQSPSIQRINRISESCPEYSKSEVWLRESLQQHNLSSQLQTLVSDAQIMDKFYFEKAFLRSSIYFQSMCICLKAVESNKVELLAQLDMKLLHHGISSTAIKRSQSMPVNVRRGSERESALVLAPPFASPTHRQIEGCGKQLTPPMALGAASPPQIDVTAKDALRNVLKMSGSETPTEDISVDCFSFYKTSTDPLSSMDFLGDPFDTIEEEIKVTDKDSVSETKPRNTSIKKTILKEDEVEGTQKPTKPPVEDIFSDSEARRLAQKQKEQESQGTKKTHKRSRSDLGLKSTGATSKQSSPTRKKILHPSHSVDCSNSAMSTDKTWFDGYFTMPRKGQSLLKYLQDQDFKTCADLDKENAHFIFSEMLIAAIEQMKWNHVIAPMATVAEEEDNDSDEEIQQLKQRIRLRKRERLTEQGRGFPALSDGRTDTTPSASTPSSSSSPVEFDSLLDSSDSSGDETRIDIIMSTDGKKEECSNLTKISSEGLSLSMASLFSDEDIQKNNDPIEGNPQEGSSCNSSAESVAISLLRKFSERQIPKASDLKWLVSEREAPQKLLPLPNSYPISPDDYENGNLYKMRLRGNLHWAPPRPQIIFNTHSKQKRNVVMAKHNYLCAGCGTRVEPGYIKRFRYCEYTGKYFCQCCHSNSLSYIPGHIISRWDFRKYYVSNFARDFIQKIFKEPLFNVHDINSGLYRKVKALELICDLRQQLFHLKNFISICKYAKEIKKEPERLPVHWSTDIHLYSLEDFLMVKNGQLMNQVKAFVTDAIGHVQGCAFCQGMGFICEICKDNTVIFPFELQKVTTCAACKACFHQGCYEPEKCPKCVRIEARKLFLQQQFSEGKENELSDQSDD